MLVITSVLTRFRRGALLQQVLGNASWQLAEKLLRMVLGLSIGIWVARYLGVAEFGLLNFAIAFVGLFSPCMDLGMQAVVVRDLVRRPERRAEIMASALVLRLCGAVAAIVISAVCITLLREGDSNARLVVLVVALSLAPQAWDVIDFDHQARMHWRPIALIRSSSLVVFSLVKIVLILSGARLIWFGLAIAAEAALSALMMSSLLRWRSGPLKFSEASSNEMKRLLAASWPLAIASLSVMLYMRIDQIMLGQMLGDEAVGVFSAAVRISESWYFIPMAMVRGGRASPDGGAS